MRLSEYGYGKGINKKLQKKKRKEKIRNMRRNNEISPTKINENMK
jgi:bisphosphoglycerate-dependent phosphoglycerate mutase